MNILFYAVTAFGLAYIVGHSVITRWIREWLAGLDFVKCDACDRIVVDDHTEVTSGWKCDACGSGIYYEVISPRRWIVMLLECPACFGFWIGVTTVVLGLTDSAPTLRNAVALGLFTSGSNYILAKITRLIGD